MIKYKTTQDLKKIDLYYVETDLLNFDVYYKTKANRYFKKCTYLNPKNVEYIKHRGSNYSIPNLALNIFESKPLQKGITQKFSYKKRKNKPKKKANILGIIIEWLKG